MDGLVATQQAEIERLQSALAEAKSTANIMLSKSKQAQATALQQVWIQPLFPCH